MSSNRYAVFAFHQYYPNGGMGDLKGSFESLMDALELFNKVANSYGDQRPFNTVELWDLHEMRCYGRASR